MRVVVAPDSFKGSLSAPDACAAMAAGLARVWPSAQVLARPMADGGEGTLDAILHAAGTAGARRSIRVTGAAGAPVTADYGLLDGGATGVVEIAQAVSITDAIAMRTPVVDRSTQGVGEIVRRLLDAGVRDIRIGLGGSSTNDAGAGLLVALGLQLLDAQGRAVAPTPRALARVERVDASGIDPRLAATRLTVLCDVNNPLTGPLGATAVFGPQKGVCATEAGAIDATLGRFAALAQRAVGREVADVGGAGAAGGLGFALMLLGARMQSGAAVVADLVGLPSALAHADWALTGEGRSDRQTLLDKAPFVVAAQARAAGVPVTLLSGAIDPASLPALGLHFAGCLALAPGPATLDECIDNAAGWLADRTEQAARVFAAARGRGS